MALDLRRRAGLSYVVDSELFLGSYEPCAAMREMGKRFLQHLSLSGPDYQGLQELEDWGRDDSVLEIITAFHPALPWDSERSGLGGVGRDYRRVENVVCPDVVIGTCHSGKSLGLRQLLGKSGISEVTSFPLDGLDGVFGQRSSFFFDSIPIKDGFEDPDADDDKNRRSLKWRSRFRFSFPRGPVLEGLGDGYVCPLEFGGALWSRAEARAVVKRQRRKESARSERLAEQNRWQEAERREVIRQAAEQRRLEQKLKEERERQEKEERERLLWDELESLLASDSVVRCELVGVLRGGGCSITWEGLSGFVPISELGDLNRIGSGRTHVAGQGVDFILTAVNRGVDFTVSRARFLERRRQEQQQVVADRQARELAKWEVLTMAQSSGEPVGVELLRRTYNRSGDVSGWAVGYVGLEGFMPNSHSGEYLGEVEGVVDDVNVVVLEVELPSGARRSGNFVVSRRKLLDSRQSSARDTGRSRREVGQRVAWDSFSVEVGEGFEGVVCGVKDFGVFVRLENGVEGLCRVKDLGGVDKLSAFSFGQRVLVSVLTVDREKMRLGFRMYAS